ncbi:lipoprotein [Streptomyces sp. NK08204]|uniref:lipoprotein n=1 Tax=Streptomyces sp. NK08204 TaxID=2873260 RepID=UPI001CED5997|nr:lipoprotein [Streptomyces sp. NK08204]
MGARAALAVALAAVLAGCGQGDGKGHGAASSTSPSTEGAAAKGPAAASGGTIGAAGSACELPVRFDVALHWKAKAIHAEAEMAKRSNGSDGDLSGALADALLRQGPVTAACEIDAKPAGNIGFLRVWTGKPGDSDARSVLRRFVAAEDGTSKERYHAVKTGGGALGVEVEYLHTSKLLDETKRESAFAVSTPDGPVVLHLSGLDSEEHDAMLPALELAKRTLRLA